MGGGAGSICVSGASSHAEERGLEVDFWGRGLTRSGAPIAFSSPFCNGAAWPPLSSSRVNTGLREVEELIQDRPVPGPPSRTRLLSQPGLFPLRLRAPWGLCFQGLGLSGSIQLLGLAEHRD